MSISVGVHEAKTTLSRLLEAAESGEEVVITRRGTPVVKLQPVGPQPRKSMFGALKGQIWMADDFDELPEETLKEFEGDSSDDLLC
ncbi:MAG TPA: type II toxin-antitoxin system Phd/YefM family antitoxin [Solirubrobacteraceae bacterium]|nr:type II toxin-antitoxin system Phd/YefM family antitoxin [Solirubrobacteraceae bacterium]